jgi:hypothetical protein
MERDGADGAGKTGALPIPQIEFPVSTFTTFDGRQNVETGLAPVF